MIFVIFWRFFILCWLQCISLKRLVYIVTENLCSTLEIQLPLHISLKTDYINWRALQGVCISIVDWTLLILQYMIRKNTFRYFSCFHNFTSPYLMSDMRSELEDQICKTTIPIMNFITFIMSVLVVWWFLILERKSLK